MQVCTYDGTYIHTCPNINKLPQYLHFIPYHSNVYGIQPWVPLTLINYFVIPLIFTMNLQIFYPFINYCLITNSDSLRIHIDTCNNQCFRMYCDHCYLLESFGSIRFNSVIASYYIYNFIAISIVATCMCGCT